MVCRVHYDPGTPSNKPIKLFCSGETYTLGGDVFNKTVTPTGIDRSRRIRYMFAFVFANAMDVHLNVSVMPCKFNWYAIWDSQKSPCSSRWSETHLDWLELNSLRHLSWKWWKTLHISLFTIVAHNKVFPFNNNFRCWLLQIWDV